jgi:hypothetical protein
MAPSDLDRDRHRAGAQSRPVTALASRRSVAAISAAIEHMKYAAQ